MRRREFRSDTMTQPTRAMRDAMRDAEVGDDVCGEDPTVNRLQEMAAERLGKEAALFVPSGVFSNQCAIAVHTRPGDAMILPEGSHVVEHETGAAAALAGVQLRPVAPSAETYPTVADVAPCICAGEDVHEPKTGLIVLENSLSDGTVMPVDEMRWMKGLAEEHGVPVHLDGARIFNAALSLGVEAREIADQADSVSFCLSKGLGAPVGSLLCATAAFIERARRRRKMMGGGMRQVGVLAAPSIIALTEGVARLHEDHANARLLCRLLADIPGMMLEPDKVQTNMVFCRVDFPGKTGEELARFLAKRNIWVYPPSRLGLRFVLSSEVNDGDVRALAMAVAEYMAP